MTRGYMKIQVWYSFDCDQLMLLTERQGNAFVKVTALINSQPHLTVTGAPLNRYYIIGYL